MACIYSTDFDRRIVTVVSSGALTMTDRYECASRIVTDRTLFGKFHLLIDLSRTTVAPSPQDINMIAGLMVRMGQRLGGRVAVLVTRPAFVPAILAVVEDASLVLEQTRVFADYDEAVGWLLEVPLLVGLKDADPRPR